VLCVGADADALFCSLEDAETEGRGVEMEGRRGSLSKYEYFDQVE
jgi:hypothetical protein